MPNPLDQRELIRLESSVKWSFDRLRPFREKSLEVIRQYVGAEYSEDGADDAYPINLLELFVNTLVTQLVGESPRTLVTTKERPSKPIALELELAVNDVLRRIRIGDTLEEATRNAILRPMGIVKVGEAEEAQVDIGGFLHRIGAPYADVIDFGDWVHDMTARRYEQVAYAGHRYRISEKVLRDNRVYRADAVDSMLERRRTVMPDGSERTESISQGSGGVPEDYRRQVELMDLWLPRERMMITVPADGPFTNLLRDPIEFYGPETGPFHILSFTSVPGQLMPLSPSANLKALHELINGLFRKASRQASRQKTVVAVGPGAEDDADRIKNARDGQLVRVNDPTALREIRFGGVEQITLGFVTVLRDLFSYTAGNLDAMAGLAPQAETVGQEKIITASASARVRHMQARMVQFTADLIRDLAWYVYTDPIRSYVVEKPIPSSTRSLRVDFGPERRRRPFEDFDFRIEPYSMRHRSPSERLNTVTQVFQQFVLPLAGEMAAQGITVNLPGLLKIVAKYTDMSELEEFLTFTEPIEPPSERLRPRQSPATTRTTVRVNRPGGSRPARDAALAQLLFGGRPQPAEAARAVS